MSDIFVPEFVRTTPGSESMVVKVHGSNSITGIIDGLVVSQMGYTGRVVQLYPDQYEPVTVSELWADLEQVAMNEEGYLQVRWFGFPAGIHVTQIWAWFQTTFNVNVTDLMLFGKPDETRRKE